MDIGSSSTLFNLDIHFNSEGWGPVAGEKIPAFIGVPYAHFDKKDKIGRAADFVSQNYQNQRQQRRRYDDMATDFAYKFDAVEDSTFVLVDNVKTVRKSGLKRQTGRTPQRGGAGARGNTGRGGRPENNRNGNVKGRKAFTRRRNDRKIDRSPSVTVAPTWEILEEFDLSQLLKLAANTPQVEDLLWAGAASQYDESFDKVTARNPKPVRRCEDKVFHYVTTSDDPILQGYAVDNAADIFITDGILAHLMASPRSVYSWDIVVQKIGDAIFFDKRNDSNLDLLTVNETSLDAPVNPEELEAYNHPDKLAEEATAINQNFSQQVVVQSEQKTFEPNPFMDEEQEGEPASVAYRYRLFKLGDIKIIARCELHSWSNKRGTDEYINVYALNEWDSRFSGGVNWRQKIDVQRGAVLATELKNNSCKVAKWTAQSILAGAEQMKIGYVSRVNATTPTEHVILGTQLFKPKDLAGQINLNVNNVWGIVKMLCELFKNKEDGKYVIFKDPNKSVMRIYSVPADSFEDEYDDEDVDGDEEEEAAEEEDIAVDPEDA